MFYAIWRAQRLPPAPLSKLLLLCFAVLYTVLTAEVGCEKSCSLRVKPGIPVRVDVVSVPAGTGRVGLGKPAHL